jgi:hypothetical protein
MATEEMSELGAMSLEELQDEVATLGSHLYAGTCCWLELVGELDRRGDWTESGCGSCAEWLAWRCALLPRAAREHVRVARRLPELPLIHAAFARGELSYSKVRALTRIAEPESEEELLELARALTAAQLERAVRAYRRVTSEEANDLHDSAYLTTFWDEDGSLEIRGRLAPEDAAVFLRALDAARDTLWERASQEERGSAGPRPTSADALVALADAALTSTPSRSNGERYQVVVHVDADTLASDDGDDRDDGDGGCTLDDGPSIAAETARRLACDASVLAISERHGRTVHVGRKTRTIPPALRRALRRATAAAAFPAARTTVSSTPTTSATGLAAARRRSTTFYCSVATTTGSSTKAATQSTNTCASTTLGPTDPARGPSPTRRPGRAATTRPCGIDRPQHLRQRRRRARRPRTRRRRPRCDKEPLRPGVLELGVLGVLAARVPRELAARET